MRAIQKLLNESFAKSAAQLMRYVCYVVMLFMTLCLILSCMGRQTFFLHGQTGSFERAIYSEENHVSHSRGLTVHSGDDIHVWTNEDDEIDLITQVGISFMYALQVVPMIAAYWLLSRLFYNVHEGKIFTESNVRYLLYYGVLQFSVGLIVPFIKLFICYIMNLISGSTISIATGQNMLDSVIPSIAFMVAAYIIHYGIHLQDEVDHTL